jgi:hypothetical protein
LNWRGNFAEKALADKWQRPGCDKPIAAPELCATLW